MKAAMVLFSLCIMFVHGSAGFADSEHRDLITLSAQLNSLWARAFVLNDTITDCRDEKCAESPMEDMNQVVTEAWTISKEYIRVAIKIPESKCKGGAHCVAYFERQMDRMDQAIQKGDDDLRDKCMSTVLGVTTSRKACYIKDLGALIQLKMDQINTTKGWLSEEFATDEDREE